MRKSLNIAILGSRGIPNRYGGFEECAEQISWRLAEKGHQVTVYTDKTHDLKDSVWKGVHRALINNPENNLGTVGQFLYDLNCNLHSRKQTFDVILHLGYTSDSIWKGLWPKKAVHLVNMDGLEWQRSKYSKPVRKFLRYAEKQATKNASVLVADSIPIREYLENAYNKPVAYITYGADIPSHFNKDLLNDFGLTQKSYDLIVARIIPDNHIDLICEAKDKAKDDLPLFILCNENKLMHALSRKYARNKSIIFHGPEYDKEKVNSLRHFARYYLHGHSAGGTNPSLLEAMACGSTIAAHNNVFNRAVLDEKGFFFSTADELKSLFEQPDEKLAGAFRKANLQRIKDHFNWEIVTDAYEKLFLDVTNRK